MRVAQDVVAAATTCSPCVRLWALATQPRRLQRTILGSVAVVGLGSTAYSNRRAVLKTCRSNLVGLRSSFVITPLVLDALSGAIGEIIQTAALYPLDTVKVRCQAKGASVKIIVSEVISAGLNRSTIRGLYAGVGPTVACSAFIGSLYLVSFYAMKRMGARLLANQAKQRQIKHRNQQNLAPFPPLASVAGPQISATASCTSHAENNKVDTSSSSGSISSNSNSSSPPEHQLAGSAQAASVPGPAGSIAVIATTAALCSSVLTSFIEAPIELFRHRVQAGALHQGIRRGMAAAFSSGGLRCVYAGYLAFMLKTIPYDVAELFTYSQLADARSSMLEQPVKGGWLAATLQGLPLEATDLTIGALAGAAAVMCSMPCDTIKTCIELQTGPAPKNLAGEAALFWRTGQRLVHTTGPSALFVGVWPRLAEKVPSTMVYWMAVEVFRRMMQPYVLRPPDHGDLCAA